MTAAAIAVERVSKRFDEVLAVDEVSFEVPEGVTVALLGGNGAGKSTTIAMLLGLLTPSAGRIEILGIDMLADRYAALPSMNFTSPYVDLPKRLTVKENLVVYGTLYGVPALRRRIARLAEDLEIEGFLGRPYGQLSSGQRTRVGLAKALLNAPRVLLLDEPTASLDPETGDWVRAYLEAYGREAGATILLASHNMAEVERLCRDVLVMKAGRIVARGAPAELIGRYGRRTLEEVFLDIARGPAAAPGPAPA